jgi:hypothetical protein
MRQKKRQELGMRAELDPATGHVRVSVDAIDADDSFENGLQGKLRVTGPEPGGETRDVPMRQTAPGRYEADFPLDRYGSFLLRAGLEKTVDPAGQGGTARTGTVAESFGHVTNPYPREYLALAPDVETLQRAATATGGSLLADARAPFDPAGESVRYHEDLWPRFAAAAIFLLVLDVLVRRVRIFDRKRAARATGLASGSGSKIWVAR